jgi:hypothetical protein
MEITIKDLTFDQVCGLVFDYLFNRSEEDRKKFISAYTDRYCIHCGSSNPNCQCWNDE